VQRSSKEVNEEGMEAPSPSPAPLAAAATSTVAAVRVEEVDLTLETNQQLLVRLLNAYALDAQGGAEPLTAYCQSNLAQSLLQMPTAHVFFAFVDGSSPAGLITSFEGFFTFKCKRLLNIHDCAVLPEYRNRGVCKAMLTFVQEFARSRDMCKLTLEVLSNNEVAKRAYTSFGFEAYALLEESGTALFWQKKLIDC